MKLNLIISKEDKKTEKKKQLFKAYYSSKSFLDNLILPPRANFSHFRCELFTSKEKKIFRKVKNIIRKKEEIQKVLVQWVPKNIYFTPTQWLDPINLKKGTDKTVSDVLLSCPLYFDVDSDSIRKSLLSTKKITNFIFKEYSKKPNLIVFSGRRGFHIYYWNWEDIDFNKLGPKQRVLEFIFNRKRIVKDLFSKNIEVDSTVTADPWRILRLPGTLHGETGLVATSISNLVNLTFIEKAKIFPQETYAVFQNKFEHSV